MVVLTFLSPGTTVRVLAGSDEVELGAGIVTVRTVEAEALHEVPLTVTA